MRRGGLKSECCRRFGSVLTDNRVSVVVGFSG